MSLSPDQERLAEALAIQRRHGDDEPRWIAERVGALAGQGDAAGVERFVEIASAYERLLAASVQ